MNAPWSTAFWLWRLSDDRITEAYSDDGWTLDFDHSPSEDVRICNASKGPWPYVCRLPDGHEFPHVAFTHEFVQTANGLYVTRIRRSLEWDAPEPNRMEATP